MQAPEHIQRTLEDIAALLSFAGASKFKAQAYARAAEVVEALAAEDLGRLIGSGRLREVDGIGPSLEKHITEIWSTGTSSLLERLQTEHPPGAATLMRLPGLTPRRITALHQGLQIDSIEALRAACEAQRVRALPGFGPKVEQRLLSAIEERARADVTPRRLLLSDALVLAQRLIDELLVQPEIVDVVLAGDARRGEETVDVLTLVVVLPSADKTPLFTALERIASVCRIDREADTAQIIEGLPVQLHPTTEAQRGAALLLATGSAAHLALLGARIGAHDSEGVLAQHASSEDAIYRAMHVAPIPPELRSGTDELVRAASDDFSDLVRLDMIRGFVHCHTTYSDGRHSIEEMARAAEGMGMRYLTITDHSPSAHYAGGVEVDRLLRQWDEIAAVQQQVGIRLLRGTESDILADGSLDYPDDILERFDVIIASIHGRFRLDRNDMTARLVRAMKLPLFKIWGHALGRLLLRRPPIDCDVEAVLDALADSRGAIEINGDPRRLDLAPMWVTKARERGIPFVLSVDAHSTQGLGVLPFAVTMARRGGLRVHEVLNTLEADAFCAKVRPSAS